MLGCVMRRDPRAEQGQKSKDRKDIQPDDSATVFAKVEPEFAQAALTFLNHCGFGRECVVHIIAF